MSFKHLEWEHTVSGGLMNVGKKQKSNRTRRKVGSLYTIIPYNNNFPDGYPANTVTPGNTYGGSVTLPYNVPMVYLGKLSKYYAKVMHDGKICKVPEHWISEKSAQ